MKRVIIIMMLLAVLSGAGSTYSQERPLPPSWTVQATDTWAMVLAPGTDAVIFAAERGFELLGPVGYLPDTYLFYAPGLGDAQMRSMRTDQRVLYLQEQFPVTGRVYADPMTEPLFNLQWHHQNTGQVGGISGVDANITDAWAQGYTGAGVNIAVIDQGVEINHPDLAANFNVAGTFDFIDSDTDPSPTFSEEDHGTMVAGTVAAGVSGGCGVGVAYEGTFSVLRQDLTYSDAVGATIFSYTRDVNAIYNGSFSWGPFVTRGADFEPLTFAAMADNTVNGRGGLGNIYVFAAGNNGLGGPAGQGENANRTGYNNSRHTIAVAASTDTGGRNPISEFGTSVFLNAPSDGGTAGILTSDRQGGTGRNGTNDNNCTNQFGDTSAAAAIVSGVAALMLDANPALTWRDVQHILAETATLNDPLNDYWQVNRSGYPLSMLYGFGRVDAGAATALAAGWANVPGDLSVSTGDIPLGQAIPDDGTAVTSSVAVDDALVIEHVEVRVDIDHASPGDLTIALTAPSGTVSELMTLRAPETYANNPDFGWDGYDDLTMMSVHHWAEHSAGSWQLSVRDERGNAVSGVINDWSLTLHGMVAAANDVTPTVITTMPFTDSVNTITATRIAADSVTPPCGVSAGYRSVWYRITPDQDGLLDLSTVGSDYDTVLAVYNGTIPLICDNDSGGNQTSLISDYVVEAGRTYTVQVSGNRRAYGQLIFNADFTSTQTAPGPFALISPVDEAGFASDEPPTTFTWSPAEDAADYDFSLSRDGVVVFEASGISAEGCGSDGCTYTLTAEQTAQLTAGIYTWTVSAGNVIGQTAAGNGPFSLTITPADELARITPAHQSIVNRSSTDLQWVPSASAEWYQIVLESVGFVHYNEWVAHPAICTATLCEMPLPITLRNGIYTWSIRTYSAANRYSGWDESYFTVEILPDASLIQRISPAPYSTITQLPTVMSWYALDGMTYYRVFISEDETTLYDQWHEAAAVCSGQVCSIPAPNTLTNGVIRWWMAGYNTSTRSYNESLFILDAPIPGPVTLDPVLTGTVNTAVDEVTFQREASTTWYNVVITGPRAVNKWYAVDDICTGEICRVVLPEVLPIGNGYQLYLAGWGPGGQGPYNTTPYTFNINVAAPGVLSNPAPASGTAVDAGPVTFTWDDDARAAWYHLYIQGAGGAAYDEWHYAPTICADGVCALEVDLAVGGYEWWVGSWGPGGNGPYNVDGATGYDLSAQ